MNCLTIAQSLTSNLTWGVMNMFGFFFTSQSYGDFWIVEAFLKVTCAVLLGYLLGLIIAKFLNAFSGRTNKGPEKPDANEGQSRVDLGQSILPDEYLQKKRSYSYGEEDTE